MIDLIQLEPEIARVVDRLLLLLDRPEDIDRMVDVEELLDRACDEIATLRRRVYRLERVLEHEHEHEEVQP